METKPAIVKKARELALAWVNKNRPVKLQSKRISSLWWHLYGEAWIEVAKEHFGPNKANARTVPDGF